MCWVCDVRDEDLGLGEVDVAQCPWCQEWFTEDAADGEQVLTHMMRAHPRQFATATA